MRNARPLVSFTFDDVPRSAFTRGAPILEAAQGYGTYYLCGTLCDGAEGGAPYLTSGDLVDLSRRGHELGCHTFSHVHVPDLSTPQIAVELDRNRRFVRKACGDVPFCSFSYPFGDVSPRARLAVQPLFASCRGINPGVNHGTADLGLLKAVSIYDRVFDEARIERWLDAALRQNGWLIFYTHDIDERPSHHGTSPAVFERLVSRVAALGLPIVTVRNALGEIGFRAA